MFLSRWTISHFSISILACRRYNRVSTAPLFLYHLVETYFLKRQKNSKSALTVQALATLVWHDHPELDFVELVEVLEAIIETQCLIHLFVHRRSSSHGSELRTAIVDMFENK